MKKIERFTALLFILVFGLLAGCGGSSTTAADPATTTTTTTPPTTPAPATATTKAVLRLSTQGVLPQGGQLSGLAITIQLPAGTTVATDTNTTVPTVAPGVVTVSGVAAQAGTTAMLPPVYTPATATAPATLQIILAGNFGVGEFVTINCATAPGSTPPSSSTVTPISFTPTDQQLRPVTVLTAGVSVTLIE